MPIDRQNMKALKANQVWDALQRGGSARLPRRGRPQFKIGDSVIARILNHSGHIRLPEYVQGSQGVVERVHGCFIFPDAHAAGSRESQYLYNVRFECADLWGRDRADVPSAVYVDLFESYLEIA